MKTGIFIRVRVSGKWGAYDIGDQGVVSNGELLEWLRARASEVGNKFYERLIFRLLNRATDIII